MSRTTVRVVTSFVGCSLLLARLASAQDAGQDAASDAAADGMLDAAPPLPDAGPPSCNLHTAFSGDDSCLPPPSNGFQLHYGPGNYDDPALVAPFVREPSGEETRCLFLRTPNAALVYTRSIQSQRRVAVQGMEAWLLPADHAPSMAPESCDDLVAAQGAYPFAATIAGSGAVGALSDAPENEGLAFRFPANAPVVVRVHGLNATDTPQLEEAWINVTATAESEVTRLLTGLALSGRGAQVPPQEVGIVRFGCAAPRELRVVDLRALTGRAVTRFSAYVARADGSRLLVYEVYDPEAPALRYDSISLNPQPDPQTRVAGGVSGILQLEAGDRIEWECEIQNTESRTYVIDTARSPCELVGTVVDDAGWICTDGPLPPSTGSGGAPPITGSGGTPSGTGGALAGTGGNGGSGGTFELVDAGSRADSGADAGAVDERNSEDSGCSCRVTTATHTSTHGLAVLLAAGTLLGRRRRIKARSPY